MAALRLVLFFGLKGRAPLAQATGLGTLGTQAGGLG